MNGVWLLVSCVVAALLLEWAVRIMYPVFDPSGRVEFECVDGAYLGPADVDLRQWTNTGEFDVSVGFNRYGFRDSKDLSRSTATDIFVVGDSFSFGQGVEAENRYSNILDRDLDVDVFNISAPNNLDGYYWLVQHAAANGATVEKLILGVCMENDLLPYGSTVAKCSPRPLFDFSLQGVKLFLTRYSAFYSLVTSIVHQNEALRSLAVEYGLAYRNDTFKPGSDFSNKVLESSADRVAGLVQGRGAVVLIIPSRGLWQGDDRKHQREIHEQFVGLLKSRGLDVVDLRPVFEASGDPLQYHYSREGHWNRKGHLKAAETLQRYIKSHDVFR